MGNKNNWKHNQKIYLKKQQKQMTTIDVSAQRFYFQSGPFPFVAFGTSINPASAEQKQKPF